MKNIIFLISIILVFTSVQYSQIYPREQTVLAGEYFVNFDPGEGNGIPITAQYGLATVEIALNIHLDRGDIAYLRFQSSNGKWSAPRGIKYKYYDLTTAQYYIKYANGSQTQFQNMTVLNEPINSPFYLAVSSNIPLLATSDSVFVRFQSSNFFWSTWSRASGIVAVGDDKSDKPSEYALYNVYPNPFNASTKFEYDIPFAAYVTLEIYDILGSKVCNLLAEHKEAGHHSILFDANHLPSSVYLCRFRADNYFTTKKIILSK